MTRYTLVIGLCSSLFAFLVYENIDGSKFMKFEQNDASANIFQNHRHLSSSTTTSTGSDGCPEVVSETGEPLFGSLISITYPKILIISVIATICFVKFVDEAFEKLQSSTAESAFREMISTIQNELMTVGLSALFLKIICNSSHFLSHEWFFALELSDILIPFYVFCCCITGINLVVVAVRQCDIWSRASRLQLDELLDDFYNVKHKNLMICCAPFSVILDQLEFRIFHTIFCDLYKIKKTVPFNDYATIVFEKYILTLIKIRPVDWGLLLAVLIALLSIRNWTNGASYYGEDCMHSGQLEEECVLHKAAILFTAFGLLILFFVCLLAVITRHYVVAVLRKAGIYSMKEYASYLKDLADKDDEVEDENKIISEEDLKAAMEQAKSNKKKSSLSSFAHDFYNYMFSGAQTHSLLLSYSNSNDDENGNQDGVLTTTEPDCETAAGAAASIPSSNSKNSKVKKSLPKSEESSCEDFEHIYERNSQVRGTSPVNKLSPGTVVSAGKRSANSTEISGEQKSPHSSIERPKSGFYSALKYVAGDRTSTESSKQANRTSWREKVKSIEGTRDFVQSVFWFSSPRLFFQTVKALLMFTSVYNAFWFANFASISVNEWKAFTFVPGIFSALIFLYIVKNAVLLKSMLEIDADAMNEVLEQAEDAKQLGQEIRSKLLAKLNVKGTSLTLTTEEKLAIQKGELNRLFRLIDDDGSNELSRSEFTEFMRSLGMTFSQKKWTKIFHQIDINFDDNISFNEFLMFLFPDDDAAKAEENRRLDEIKQRVQIKRDNNLR